MKKRFVGAAVVAISACATCATSGSAFAANAPKKTTATTVATAAKPKAPLGDLSKFRTITSDTLAFAKAGDLKKAEHRITDMETKWDAYENALKGRDKVRWTQLDQALDKVLKALRASKPDGPTSVAALQEMLALIDSFK